MGTTILKTKLFIPPLQNIFLPRPRLIERIEESVCDGKALTLVAAPAGFGKTTAVSAWVQTCACRTAWLSLDEADNEPVQFWTYIIAAIRTQESGFGEEILAALTAAPPPAVNSILPDLINQLVSLAEPVTLVLDDYHVIENPAIHDSLTYLLNHRPPQLHLLVATRADPPLQIARLRGQQLLTELRSRDLRFSGEEVRQLLNETMQLGLELEDVHLLEARTEGWGVGLLLAAQSLQGRSDKHEFIAAFTGSHHYILEYLIAEVLDRQPEDLREFMLQTSVLDALCGSLCDFITQGNNANETLASLYQQHLFIIPLDQDRQWYRYHHLFGDLLANFLRSEYPESHILALHRRASDWFEREGDADKAVKYALSGQDYERAAGLIEQQADVIISRGQVKMLLQWINALPKDMIETRPRLLMRLGWATFLTGKVNEARKTLLSARSALDGAFIEAGVDLLRGRLNAMLSTITALTRDISGAIAEAEEALKYLPEDEWIFRARATRAMGVSYAFLGEVGKAIILLEQAKDLALKGQNRFLAAEILSQIGTQRKHQGRYQQAFDAYRQILGLYTYPEKAPPACLGYFGMAEIALKWNRLEEASRYLEIGVQLCRLGNIGYALQPAFLLQGLLKQAQGDDAGAEEAIRQGENLSRIGGGSLESILMLAETQTRFHLLRGDIDTAAAWASGSALPPGWSFQELPLTLAEVQACLLARVACRRGETEEVLRIHDRVWAQAERGGRTARLIEIDLFKAIALEKAGNGSTARQAFERSLALAEAEGLVRLFIEGGETVKTLLKAAARGPHGDYARQLLSAFAADATMRSRSPDTLVSQQPLIEPLTARELEVLRMICAGLTNQAIAERLIVSVNTIKSHSGNIYSKLGVRNRAQAVIRAREIGLIQ